MKLIFTHLEFTWRKLLLLGLLNSVISAAFVYGNIYYPSVFWSVLLFVINLLTSTVFLFLTLPLIQSKKWYYITLNYLILLSPFLSFPYLFYLWTKKNHSSHIKLNKIKFSFIILGCFLSLFVSLKNIEYFKKHELLIGRIIPAELSYIYLSAIEYSRVSALTPYDSITLPTTAKKILVLRQSWAPNLQEIKGINPASIFKVLPLGMGWFRGFPSHSFAIMQFYIIAYDSIHNSN